MLITIQNEFISLTVDTLGAQMMSIRGKDGCEYLWQGDPAYWSGRAPTLFPVIGRLYDNRCTVHGKPCTMGIHGFAAEMDFTPTEQGEDYLVLTLDGNIATLVLYPFDFALEITYRLTGSTVAISYRVSNKSANTMPFAVGGHPGFRVPLLEGERFEDYCLEFNQRCLPDRILFTEKVLVSGQAVPYPLEDGKRISLTHGLFDNDAIILQNMDREVTLRSAVTGRGVTVSCPDMPYLGFWHWPKRDAPYVCIEPWSSLPARHDVVEELSCRSDFIRLSPGETYENNWSITLIQGETAHD